MSEHSDITKVIMAVLAINKILTINWPFTQSSSTPSSVPAPDIDEFKLKGPSEFIVFHQSNTIQFIFERHFSCKASQNDSQQITVPACKSNECTFSLEERDRLALTQVQLAKYTGSYLHSGKMALSVLKK